MVSLATKSPRDSHQQNYGRIEVAGMICAAVTSRGARRSEDSEQKNAKENFDHRQAKVQSCRNLSVRHQTVPKTVVDDQGGESKSQRKEHHSIEDGNLFTKGDQAFVCTCVLIHGGSETKGDT